MPFPIKKTAGDGENAWVLKNSAGAAVLKLRFALLPESAAAEAPAAAAAARIAKRPRLDHGAMAMDTATWEDGKQIQAALNMDPNVPAAFLHPANAPDIASSRKAEGVTGVDTSDPIDPITELGTIAGVDSSTLETFKTEAAEAAAMTPSSQPPPSSMSV